MSDIHSLTGDALDARIAERLFGWRIAADQTDEHGRPLYLAPVRSFSAEAPSARGAMFQLERRHPSANLRIVGEDPWRAAIEVGSGSVYEAEGPTEGVAICRAILETLAGEGPGRDPREAAPIRGIRAARAAADLLASKAPEHPMGIMFALMPHIMQLEQGGTAAELRPTAQAVLGFGSAMQELATSFSRVAARPGALEGAIGIEGLASLARASKPAIEALREVAGSADASMAAKAREVLESMGEPLTG